MFAIVFICHHKQVMRQALSFFLHLFLNLQVVVLSLYPAEASHSQLLSSVDIHFQAELGSGPGDSAPAHPKPVGQDLQGTHCFCWA